MERQVSDVTCNRECIFSDYVVTCFAADGFNGMILTEMSLDKLLILQQQLGFDGNKLGVKFGPDYDASKNPIWFAHKVAVKETQK